MAIISNQSLLAGVRGKVGAFVIKRYGNKIVLSAKPCMRNLPPSDLQRRGRERFAAAVQYAKSIMNNPEKKALYEKKVAKGQTVFHFAIKEFLMRPVEKESR